jgi:hypothetical protein
MIRLRPALALAAALCLAVALLAAQVSPPNPFAVERAERHADGWHPRHERHRRHDGRRLERRGERHGDRMEHRGRRWERHGERLRDDGAFATSRASQRSRRIAST